MTFIFRVLEAVVGFGFLVLVHELGHFLAAKWVGVRVEAFSFGFGSYITVLKKGDTEYRLSAIPLGGYVKMSGEEAEDGKPLEPDMFCAKSVGQRALVFVAGPAMNLIFGFLIFMLAYRVGVPVIPSIVGGIAPASPAWKAGLQRGDHIVRVDNISPPIDFEDLKTAVTLAGPGESVTLGVRRDGKEFNVVVKPEYSEDVGLKTVGIVMPTTMTIVSPALLPKTPEEEGADAGAVYRAGLKEGDTITAVRLPKASQAMPIATAEDFQDAIDRSGGQPLQIMYRRGENAPSEESVTMTPQPIGKAQWAGIRYGSTKIKAVRPGSWAEQGGLRDDNVLVAAEGKSLLCRTDALEAIKSGRSPLTVRRDGHEVIVALPAGRDFSNIESVLAFEPGLVVDSLMKDYPAEKMGLQAGDVMVAADGKTLKEPGELSEIIIDAKGAPVELTWTHDGKKMTGKFTPQKRLTIVLPLKSVRVTLKAGLSESIALGARKAMQWTVRIYATLRSLLLGEVSARHLSGPLSIGYLTYAAASQGLGTFLYIVGLLSINLGIFNLLPIPVLDGGHLFFALIERIRGKVLHERVRTYATWAGLSLILALLVLAFWNDIRSFIGF